MNNCYPIRFLLILVLSLNVCLAKSQGKADSLLYLGDICFKQQLYDQCLTYYNQSLELFKSIKDTSGIIQCYNRIGHTLFYQELFAKAMENYLVSLNMAESEGEKKEIANCYINIANVLNAQADYGNSIQYLEKSLEVFEKLGDKYNMAVCYNNIAAGFIYQDSLKQALYYLDKSLKIYIDLQDQKGQAACYLNMGIVSDKSDEYQKAIEYYLSALKINEILNDKYRITLCLANLSITQLKIRKYADVIESSERGLRIAKEINVIDVQRIFYESLSSTYDSLKNYQKAFEYHKLFKQTNDTVLNAERRKQVLEMEAKYSNEKKEIEISNLTKDLELKAVELEKNRNFLFFSVVIILLVLVLFGVFYRLYKLRLNTSKMLALKNEELELMNRTLSDSESSLKELNATKDKFFTIIAHDIKNPLSAYRSVTKMLTNSFYELSEQQKLEYIKGINKSSENLYELFQNLLQWSTSQAGSMPFKPQEIDMGIIAFKAVTVLQESADKKNLQVEMNVETDTYAFGDINMVSIVMVNLLSNAIKYSMPGGQIEVTTADRGQYLKISVVDNGIGLNKEDLEKLFRIDIDHKSIGNSEEKGTGIGLILCKEFVNKNGGEIWVESEPGKGSAFHFTLPKEAGSISK
jgi:signal transduction histidine kinase